MWVVLMCVGASPLLRPTMGPRSESGKTGWVSPLCGYRGPPLIVGWLDECRRPPRTPHHGSSTGVGEDGLRVTPLWVPDWSQGRRWRCVVRRGV